MAFTLEYFYHQTQHKYRLQLLIPNARLDHRISWVHLVEDSNNSSFLRGNELVITTGLETAGSDQLLSFIKRLWERHVCGLVLNMGPYCICTKKRTGMVPGAPVSAFFHALGNSHCRSDAGLL